jgi:hypothetical protein
VFRSLPVASGLAALVFVAAVGLAQPVRFSREVQRGVDHALTSRVELAAGGIYGEVRAGLLPEEGYHTTYHFALGIRPSVGRTELDFRADYQLQGFGDPGDSGGTLTVDVARPIGGRVRVETFFRLDPGASVVAVESRLKLHLTEHFDLTRRIHRDFGIDEVEDGATIYEIGGTHDAGSSGQVNFGLLTDAATQRIALRYELTF